MPTTGANGAQIRFEDAGVTKAEIVHEFGPDVTALVLEVTDDKSLPQAERKRMQILKAPHKSVRAAMIKLDKVSNLRAILSSPPVDWSVERKREYFEWAKEVVGVAGTESCAEGGIRAAVP